MAKENLALQHGFVQGKPRIYQDNDGNPIRAMFCVEVMRRPSDNAGYNERKRFDCPVYITDNQEIIKKVAELEPLDVVDIKAVVTTMQVKKYPKACPECGYDDYELQGQYGYLTPLSVRKCGHVETQKEGVEMLGENREYSNLVLCIGTVCLDPRLYTDEAGKCVCQYPLAVNRKYRISMDDPESKTDWPWVKTYGEQARLDSEILKEGATVYVNGSYQVRKITRTVTCPNCGKTYQFPDSVSEIRPYSVEYLFNNKQKDDDEGWNPDYSLPDEGIDGFLADLPPVEGD